jgi:predicted dehydrogenase
MRVLLNGRWRAGHLDYARGEDEYRIAVAAWSCLMRIDDKYFVRSPSLRGLLAYVGEIGPRNVALKVRSRLGERGRNEKFVACGVGTVSEAPAGGRLAPGSPVAFLAPDHPAAVERIVLPEALLAPWDRALPSGAGRDWIGLFPARDDPAWADLAAWSPFSGRPVAPGLEERLLPNVRETIAGRPARRLALRPGRSAVRQSRPARLPRPRDSRPACTLVGYGNYAKTVCIPNLRRHVDVTRIHEIDPTQVPGRIAGARFAWDTRPAPGPDDDADLWAIAGFHHTHAGLAAAGLRRGAYVAVEKPLVTTAEELREVLDALGGSQGALISCFHKRYSTLNAIARADLGVEPGEAVSYHCIVYEEPLPARHWYRWPTSRSRLVSNGCHWIDHFLFLNGFSALAGSDVRQSSDGTISCFAELENGASFTMALTDQGSARIGVQDHVELRANRRTVRILNGSRYEAEGASSILRRARVGKTDAYARMYRSVGAAVARGDAGDSVESIEASAGAILRLDAQLNAA